MPYDYSYTPNPSYSPSYQASPQSYTQQPSPLQGNSIFQNTGDILNISLAAGFVIIVIFLCLALFHLTLVLRDLNHITKKLKETTDQLSNYILRPISLLSKLLMNLKPIIEIIERKIQERKGRAQKKKKREG